MGKTVIGLFDEYEEAQRVVEELTAAGFSRNDISIVSNNANSRFGASGSGTGTGGGSGAGSVAGGIVGGAAEGAVIGGLTGLAASLALLLIPGVGPIAAAGPLAAMLSGAGLGAVGGGVIGALSKLGVPKEEARYYAEGIRRGGTLVSVTVPDERVHEAHAVFERYNPVDIEDRAAYYHSTGFQDYDQKAAPYTPEQIAADRDAYNRYSTARNTPTAGMETSGMGATGTTGVMAGTATGMTGRTLETGQEVRVPVVEEELAVGTREVERGRARIHTFVQEVPVQEQVTLREEHVHVERRPVDRNVTDGDLSTAFQEQTIDVTERAEVPVVAKEARVVEEVVINKEATERTETIQDTVRRTDVEVDETGGMPIAGTDAGTTRTSPGITGATDADTRTRRP
jgi:uncharacterized protein (TIGR02271 family)